MTLTFKVFGLATSIANFFFNPGLKQGDFNSYNNKNLIIKEEEMIYCKKMCLFFEIYSKELSKKKKKDTWL